MKIEIGNVCKCSRKKLGIVTRVISDFITGDLTLATGIGFDGKPWQSKNPTVIAENMDAFIESN